MNFVWFIIIGGVAGWLAGLIMKGRGFGILSNIIVGIVGAVLGGWLLGAAGVWPGGGVAGELLTALLGAIVLLGLISLGKRA